MWVYEKTLQYPVNLKCRDLRMAKVIMTQLGGPNGELAAALRYLQQRYTMPTGKSKGLLTDIGTEELKAAGMDTNYAQFGHGIQPTDSNGVPFTTAYINVFSDPVTDLHENMAAEQKALATYYQLINLTDDPDIKDVLSFLGQREITHYQRFGEALMDVYDFTECKKIF